MARTFVAASSQSLANSSAPVTAAPITMACWFKPASIGATSQSLMSLSDGTANNFFLLRCVGASGTISAITGAGGASSNSDTVGAATAGTWAHCAAIFASSTSRTAYLNGTASTPNTTSRVPSGINATEIGVVVGLQYADGDIGEAAIWNIALTAADMAVLAAGVSPLLVRPDALVFYAPLMGAYSPEIELIGHRDLTVTGATTAQHPRMFAPVPVAFRRATPSGLASAISLSFGVSAVLAGSLFVNGFDRTAQYDRESLTIQDDLNELPNGCSFDCFGFTPVEDQIVAVLNGTTKEFEGKIVTVVEYHDKLNARTVFRVTCSDYTIDADALVTKSYGSQSATTTGQDLITNFGSGFTQAHIAASLPTVDAMQYRMTPLATALRQLCDAFGGDSYFDYDKDTHVFLTETDVVPDAISVANRNWRNFSYTRDRSRLANRIFVEGQGSRIVAPRVAGDTTAPLDDSSMFSSSGGTAIVNSQILTYTGKSVDANKGTAVQGIQKGPTAPSASIDNTSAGRIVGAVKYGLSFVSADGESEVSPVSSAITGTQIPAPIAPSCSASGAATFNIDYACVLLDADGNETALGTVSHAASPVTAGDPAMTVDLTNADGSGHSPWGVDSRVIGWRIYRRKFALAPASPSGDFYRIADIIDPTHATLSYVDHTNNANTGATMNHATVNNTGGVSTVTIGNGPTGTTSKRVYRTAGGSSVLQYLTSVSDNTTTSLTDKAADSSLGAVAPSGSSVKTLAGSTTLTITDLSQPSEGSGWARVGSQVVSFTGRSASSGIGTLTGIPASGTGALVSDVSAGSTVTFLPFLKGVPASATGSIVDAIAAGDAIALLVQRDDTTSQATYGIRQANVSDSTLTITGAQVRGDAELTLRKDPTISGSFITTDTKIRSGRRITVSMASEWGISGTFTITKVAVAFEADRPLAQRTVSFSNHATDKDLYRVMREMQRQLAA